MKRTLLPLNALRVFDAAARHLNFTRAASELAVTPAAVGQQIRALEELLGVVLFRRTPKGLELTAEAEAGLEALRGGFVMFEEAVRTMQHGQGAGKLTIAAPPEFVSLWLAPYLSAYARERPDFSLALVASEGISDFSESNLDLAIWLTADAGEHEAVPLGAEAERGWVQLARAEAADVALGWPAMPSDATGPVDGRGGGAQIDFADAASALAAAVSGLGHVSVPKLLALPYLADGRLKILAELSDPRSYHLAAPRPQWRQAKVKAFVSALTGG